MSWVCGTYRQTGLSHRQEVLDTKDYMGGTLNIASTLNAIVAAQALLSERWCSHSKGCVHTCELMIESEAGPYHHLPGIDSSRRHWLW